MRAIYTECVVSLSDPVHCASAGKTYDAEAIVIRVVDEAAGPFLMVEGRSELENEDGHTFEHSFSLQSAAEIDRFAAICKAMLKQAE